MATQRRTIGRKNWALVALAATVATAALASEARAQSASQTINVFTDSATTTTSISDPDIWDVNLDKATRQSGYYVPAGGISTREAAVGAVNYTQVNNQGQPGTFLLATDHGGDPFGTAYPRISPDFNFVPLPGTTEMSISTTLYPSPSASWMAMGIGGLFDINRVTADGPNSGTFVNQVVGLSLLLGANGGWQTFNGPGANVSGGNVSSLVNTAPSGNPKFDVKWVLHNPVFDGSTPVNVSLYLNGTQVDANGASDGLDLTRTFTDSQVFFAHFSGGGGIQVSFAGPLAITASTTRTVWTPGAPGPGNFNSGANWSTSSAPAGAYSVAEFGAAGSGVSGGRSVQIGQDTTVGGLVFSDDAYALSGTGKLTLDAGAGGRGQIYVETGSQSIANPILLSSRLSVFIRSGSTLTLNSVTSADRTKGVEIVGGGTVKLAGSSGQGSVLASGPVSINNDGSFLDLLGGGAVISGSSEASVRALVTRGLAGQGGLGSSLVVAGTTTVAVLANDEGLIDYGVANGVPYFDSFGGVTGLAATDVIARYTYVGDINLDGVVDGADYKIANESIALGRTGFAAGDVNLDGVIDDRDLSLIDGNVGGAVIGLPGGGTESVRSIPEPMALTVMPVGAVLMRRRRA